MIESVHIPIYCDSESAQEGALLTLKTIRVGFPTKPVTVHFMGIGESFLQKLKDICRRNFSLETESVGTNDELISRLFALESRPFAVVDSDVVFFENCEDFEPSRLIAGEFTPEFVCPIAKAITYSRLHTAFFVVADPVKLRREIDLAYRPAIPKFCPFDPFSPVVTFKDCTPHFYDSCSLLYHAIGGESFAVNMLRRFEHLHAGSYAFNGVHADRIKAAYINPESARGTREMMRKYFEERTP